MKNFIISIGRQLGSGGKEIAEKFALTPARVRQIIEKASRRLKKGNTGF